MTRLILVRHGYSVGNKEVRFSGQADIPLDEIGILQHRKVPGDGRTGYGEMVGNFAGRHTPGFQQVQYFPANGIGQGFESVLHTHTITPLTFNLNVKYIIAKRPGFVKRKTGETGC